MSVPLDDPRWLELSAHLNRARVGVIVRTKKTMRTTAYFLPDARQPAGVLKEGGAYFDAISLLRALSRALATVTPRHSPEARLASERACDLMSEIYEETGGKNP